ncbi:hypothetical protein ACL58G_07920 [Massilia sp. GER05]|jgi:hypothetical protein|uniref:hypothetical protein n=1 Tax=Massilia sp. GER05 TaxID=3394605 RepID=UPI003F8798D7
MTIQNYVHDGSTMAAAAAIQGAAVPALTKRIIRAATICNSTAAPVAASAWLVPSGGAADATNIMISARTIAAGESYPCPELVNQGLNAGGAVYGLGLGLTFKYTATDIS